MQALTDTSTEVAQLVHDRLMALSGAERFRMGVEMFDTARRMVLASFPAKLTDAERKRRLFERVYGEPLPNQAEILPLGPPGARLNPPPPSES